jgi:hypothetical protein
MRLKKQNEKEYSILNAEGSYLMIREQVIRESGEEYNRYYLQCLLNDSDFHYLITPLNIPELLKFFQGGITISQLMMNHSLQLYYKSKKSDFSDCVQFTFQQDQNVFDGIMNGNVQYQTTSEGERNLFITNMILNHRNSLH